jgi:cell division protein FtsB
MKLRFLLGALLLGGAAYFAIFGGDYSLVELQRIKRELQQERARLETAEAETARLRARVDSLENDSATIERIARERWGLIKPGERLYRFEQEDSARDTTSRALLPDTLRSRNH